MTLNQINEETNYIEALKEGDQYKYETGILTHIEYLLRKAELNYQIVLLKLEGLEIKNR